VLASASHELRNGVFAKAGQRLGRRLTLAAFHNLLSLDAEFFSASRTGALTRIVDRGTRSVLTLFRTVVLAFLPTLFEVVLVCGVLLSRFELRYVLVLLATFAAYMWWTVFMSAVLGRLRAEMNLVDNATASKATDSLYNYETVALFDARDLEVARLDVSLREYEGLATENEWQYALQNVLQTAVYTCGLTAILVIGALGVVAGGATVGDLVMMSSLLAQLWVPCQYFGWQYREATQAAVDVGNLFSVLEEASSVVDNRDRDLHVSRGEVSFENVSFTYPSRGSEAGDGDDDDGEEDDRTVLNDISFTVPAGKTVALCGAVRIRPPRVAAPACLTRAHAVKLTMDGLPRLSPQVWRGQVICAPASEQDLRRLVRPDLRRRTEHCGRQPEFSSKEHQRCVRARLLAHVRTPRPGGTAR
jgi:ATP-binding cassette, subfamily B, heavy metal transporter